MTIGDNSTAAAFAALCLALAAAHVLAVRRPSPLLAGISKACASTVFVLMAYMLGAAQSTYGRLILTALLLSWLGDLLLLSRKSRLFVMGIGAFLLAHICFAAAFLTRPFRTDWLLASLVVTAIAGAMLHRWLRPHLAGVFRFAVPVYIAVIMVMVSFAVAVSAATGSFNVAAGAVIFAVSDVFVARDRFVDRGFVNKLWGIPLYYIAQLLLAASVLAW